MAYHEAKPWRDPGRKQRPARHAALGALLSVAVFVVLAVIEIQAALIFAGLALLTLLLLLIGAHTGRRRDP
ncbi:hypothetical protein [Streptomyces sp. NPDC053367]|uniref:hypothetical protein n=1 Tax=Streptomyces sp. NPDC053367 TaxID=3365700 RepID=UPI0037D7C79F